MSTAIDVVKVARERKRRKHLVRTGQMSVEDFALAELDSLDAETEQARNKVAAAEERKKALKAQLDRTRRKKAE